MSPVGLAEGLKMGAESAAAKLPIAPAMGELSPAQQLGDQITKGLETGGTQAGMTALVKDAPIESSATFVGGTPGETIGGGTTEVTTLDFGKDATPLAPAEAQAQQSSTEAQPTAPALNKVENTIAPAGERTEPADKVKAERDAKLAAINEKIDNKQALTRDEAIELQNLKSAEQNEARLTELGDKIKGGDTDPATIKEYNKLVAERDGKSILTPEEQVKADMDKVMDGVLQKGEATEADWTQMVDLFKKGNLLAPDVDAIRQDSVKKLMQAMMNPDNRMKFQELTITKNIAEMIAEVNNLMLEIQNLPEIQKKAIADADAQKEKVKGMYEEVKDLPQNEANNPKMAQYNLERQVLLTQYDRVVQLKALYKTGKSQIDAKNKVIDAKLGIASGWDAFVAILQYGMDYYSTQAQIEFDSLVKGLSNPASHAIKA